MTELAKRLTGAAAGVAAMTAAGVAHAAPNPWGIYLPEGASPIAQDIYAFGNLTFWIITPITMLVLGLLLIVIIRFNAKSNPIPSKTSHNTAIEVIWTVAPVLALLIIAVPSFRLLYDQQIIPEADLTVKVTGNKWYWSYEYPENDDFAFDSTRMDDETVTDITRDPRLLAVDYPMVVPVDQVVRVQVTASDVIHAFAMNAMGVKVDAVPGRLNETWFRAIATGVYYGQCTELCGLLHAYMPIELRVVTADQYAQWLEVAQQDLAAGKELLESFRDSAAEVAAR